MHTHPPHYLSAAKIREGWVGRESVRLLARRRIFQVRLAVIGRCATQLSEGTERIAFIGEQLLFASWLRQHC